jgi:hypothetical protein
MFKRKGLIPVFLVFIASLVFIGLAFSKHWAKTDATAAPRPGAASATLAQGTDPRTQEPNHEQRNKALEKYGRLPLSFIENQGQADGRIAYYIQSPTAAFTSPKTATHCVSTRAKGTTQRPTRSRLNSWAPRPSVSKVLSAPAAS